ncbi:MAG: hypothetical protein Q9217_001696 [Psora testacea]
MWFQVPTSVIGIAASIILGGTVVEVAHHVTGIGPCVLTGLGCSKTLPAINTTHAQPDSEDGPATLIQIITSSSTYIPNIPPPITAFIVSSSSSLTDATQGEKLPTLAPSTDFQAYSKHTSAEKYARHSVATTSLSRCMPPSQPTLLAWIAFWPAFLAHRLSPTLYLVMWVSIYVGIFLACAIPLCYIEVWVRDVYERRKARAAEIRIYDLYKENTELKSDLQWYRSQHKRDTESHLEHIAVKDEAIRTLSQGNIHVTNEFRDRLAKQEHGSEKRIEELQAELQRILGRNKCQYEELGKLKRLIRTRDYDLEVQKQTITNLSEDPTAEYKKAIDSKLNIMISQRDYANRELKQYLAGEKQLRPKPNSIKATMEMSEWTKDELYDHIADLDFRIEGTANNSIATAEKSKSDINTARDQINLLNRENQTLQERNEALVKDCSAFHARIGNLESGNNALQEQVKESEKAQKHLDAEVTRLREELKQRPNRVFRVEYSSDESDDNEDDTYKQGRNPPKLALSTIVTTLDVPALAEFPVNSTVVESTSRPLSPPPAPLPSDLAARSTSPLAAIAPTGQADEPDKPPRVPIEPTEVMANDSAAPVKPEDEQIPGYKAEYKPEPLAESPSRGLQKAGDSADWVDETDKPSDLQLFLNRQRRKKYQGLATKAKKANKMAGKDFKRAREGATRKPKHVEPEVENRGNDAMDLVADDVRAIEPSEKMEVLANIEPEVRGTSQDAPPLAPSVNVTSAPSPDASNWTGADAPSQPVQQPLFSISSLLSQATAFEVPKTTDTARHPLTDPGHYARVQSVTAQQSRAPNTTSAASGSTVATTAQRAPPTPIGNSPAYFPKQPNVPSQLPSNLSTHDPRWSPSSGLFKPVSPAFLQSSSPWLPSPQAPMLPQLKSIPGNAPGSAISAADSATIQPDEDDYAEFEDVYGEDNTKTQHGRAKKTPKSQSHRAASMSLEQLQALRALQEAPTPAKASIVVPPAAPAATHSSTTASASSEKASSAHEALAEKQQSTTATLFKALAESTPPTPPPPKPASSTTPNDSGSTSKTSASKKQTIGVSDEELLGEMPWGEGQTAPRPPTGDFSFALTTPLLTENATQVTNNQASQPNTDQQPIFTGLRLTTPSMPTATGGPARHNSRQDDATNAGNGQQDDDAHQGTPTNVDPQSDQPAEDPVIALLNAHGDVTLSQGPDMTDEDWEAAMAEALMADDQAQMQEAIQKAKQPS